MRTNRSGFTMTELLVGLVLTGMVALVIYQTIWTQTRGYAVIQATTRAQQTSRTALGVLATELREASPREEDLILTSSDSIKFRTPYKLGIICDLDVGAREVVVYRLGDAFVKHDSVMLHMDNDTTKQSDDTWEETRLKDVDTEGSNANCPTWTYYSATGTSLGNYSLQRLEFENSVNFTNTVARGGVVRSYTQKAYAIYLIDGEYMLGRRTSDGGNSPSALIGPTYSAADHGLWLEYYDTLGNAISAPTTSAGRKAIGRVWVRVIAEAQGDRSSTKGNRIDTLSTLVYLAN